MKYIIYRTMKFICKPIFALLFNPKIEGLDNIPKTDSVILAGNHTNNLDALLMLYGPKRIVHMMAKKELFNSWLKNAFFKSMACISVDRSTHDKKAKNTAIEVLKDNGVVGIFPEGTINKTDKIILPFKYGAVSMASKTNAYIVPFTITGKYFKRNIKITYSKAYKVSADLEKENKKLENIIIKLLKENNK